MGLLVRIVATLLLVHAGLAYAQDATLTRAGRLVDNKQYKQAYELLAPLEQQRAGDPAFDYLLGFSALKVGELTRAVFALERVLAVRPDDGPARAAIGEAYLNMGENKTAREELENARRAKPTPEATAAIDKFLDILDSRERTRKGTGVTGYLELGLGYDSNVSAATSSNTFAVPQQGSELIINLTSGQRQTDWYSTQAGGVNGRYALSDTLGLIAGGSFERKVNFTEDRFDTGAVSGSVGINWRQEANEFTFAVQGQSFFVDNTDFRDALGVVAQFRRTLATAGVLSAFTQVTQLKYPQDHNRDANRYVLGGQYVQPIGGTAAVYFGGYFGKEEEVRSDQGHFGHDLWALRTGGQVGVTDKTVLVATASYEDRKYHATDPFFFGVTRHDRDMRFSLSTIYSFDRNWSVTPAVNYTRNLSNIVVNEYNRWLFSMTARYDFR
jgi:outer membrane protein